MSIKHQGLLKKNVSIQEFIILMTLIISVSALSIDTLLPALPMIAKDLGVIEPERWQLMVSSVFLGISIGQIFYGPISDSVGRKPVIYIGFSLFAIGCLLSSVADSFSMMLFGRFLQGAGAASARVVVYAIVRDQFDGKDMARIMSLITSLLIIVPMIAPIMGQSLLMFSHWRTIFIVLLFLSLIALAWFAIRIPETLTNDKKHPFSFSKSVSVFRTVISNRETLAYASASGLVLGMLIGYLCSCQVIFHEYYNVGNKFPLYFALTALSIGSASFVSARYVAHYGAANLVKKALYGMIASTFCVFIMIVLNHNFPLWLFLSYICIVFFCIGLLFGNLTALAMQPFENAAGMAAAIIGSLSSLLAIPFGVAISIACNSGVLPIVIGFLALSSLALCTVQSVTEKSA